MRYSVSRSNEQAIQKVTVIKESKTILTEELIQIDVEIIDVSVCADE